MGGQPSERAFLVIRAPNGDVREVSVGEIPIVIGRDESADVRVDDKRVSRRHASFKLINGEPWVEDLGSVNGVKINGERIERRKVVRDGDVVRVGGYDVQVRPDDGASPTPEALPEMDYEAAPEPPAELPPAARPIPPADSVPATAGLQTAGVPVGPSEVLDPAAPSLYGLDPPAEDQRFVLERGENVIGRLEDCDVAILDGSVSRQHARVLYSRGRVSVTDLNSSNGTFVNDTRVEEAGIHDGDVLRTGSVAFRLEFPGEEGRPPPVAKSRAPPPTKGPRFAFLGMLGLLIAVAVLYFATGRSPDPIAPEPEVEPPVFGADDEPPGRPPELAIPEPAGDLEALVPPPPAEPAPDSPPPASPPPDDPQSPALVAPMPESPALVPPVPESPPLVPPEPEPPEPEPPEPGPALIEDSAPPDAGEPAAPAEPAAPLVEGTPAAPEPEQPAPAPPTRTSTRAPAYAASAATSTSPFGLRDENGWPLGLPPVDDTFDFDGFVGDMLRQAEELAKKQAYGQLRQVLLALLARDPINRDARNMLETAERDEGAQGKLQRAFDLAEAGKGWEAIELYRSVPADAPAAAEAKERLKVLEPKVVASQLERATREAQRRGRWRSAHARLKQVLQIDPKSERARTLIYGLEKKMRRKRMRFVPYALPTEVAAGAPTLEDTGKDGPKAAPEQTAVAPTTSKAVKLYMEGSIKKAIARAKRTARRSKGAAKRRAQRLAKTLRDLQTKYRRVRTALGNEPREAWGYLIEFERLERTILPDGAKSFLKTELEHNIADAFADRGAAMFEQERYQEAFESWESGFKLNRMSPTVLAGLEKLEKRAEQYAQEAELAAQRGEPGICERWRKITRMTTGTAEVHKKARERVRQTCSSGQ